MNDGVTRGHGMWPVVRVSRQRRKLYCWKVFIYGKEKGIVRQCQQQAMPAARPMNKRPGDICFRCSDIVFHSPIIIIPYVCRNVREKGTSRIVLEEYLERL